jgi:hypothetical protein
MADTPSIAKQFFGIAPYFFVRDVVKAAEYYRDALGFSYAQFWGVPPTFCMPRRDGVTIMLSQTRDSSIIRPNAKARRDHVASDPNAIRYPSRSRTANSRLPYSSCSTGS